MVIITDIDFTIMRELIGNPRRSDAEISEKTGTSPATISRRRRALEQKGWLNYFTYVNNGPDGTKTFSAKKLYIVTFAQGITRHQVSQIAFKDYHRKHLFNKHIYSAHLGDSKGRVTLAIMLQSRVHADFVDILNGEIIPFFRERLGSSCVTDIFDMDVEETLRVLHNYEGNNLQVIDKETVFVTDISFIK